MADRATSVTGKKHVLAERLGNLSKAGRVKLVFSRLAYLLLTHLALAADAQACAERLKPLRLPGIPQLQQHLRSQLWDALIVRLERSPKARPGARKIKELIQQ
jgi:hypothetical protein